MAKENISDEIKYDSMNSAVQIGIVACSRGHPTQNRAQVALEFNRVRFDFLFLGKSPKKSKKMRKWL